MSAHIAEAVLDEVRVPVPSQARSISTVDADFIVHEDTGSLMRGVMVAALISLPFWSFVGAAIYFLL